MSVQFVRELEELIRARYSLLYLVTWEEDRARRLLIDLAANMKKYLFEWSITDGLRSMNGSPENRTSAKRLREPLAVLNEILQADVSGIYILKDFHTYLETPEIVRQLRDLASALRRSRKTVIILSPTLKVPPEMEKAITIVDMPLPSYQDLSDLLEHTIRSGEANKKFDVRLSGADRDAMVKAAMGLTLGEAENAFAHAIVLDKVLDRDDVKAVAAEKRQIIRKSGLLEFYEVTENLAGVGGMDSLKDWLCKRVRAFSPEAREYGLPQPRGILLMGVQGCGKSLLAKTISAEWRLPLLRMDMSMIFQGYIGSSEQNMRKAVQIAESVAPVILWIDEIEKAFSGVQGSGSSDAGTTARVVGTFLTWIQEKTAPVFVVATANDVQELPPELLRKGRFDEVFFVDLPGEFERAEIFAIHLAKLRREPSKFDLSVLSKSAEGFSGAEIEQAIVSAMHDSFFAGRDVTTEDILVSLRETVPLSKTMRERITDLREWARTRSRPVSTAQGGQGSVTADG
ncbi:MAG: AAA family ATPase [Candidatus Hydrogenedentes bacterium]|nr:AAA family ATPase [Candidatus Hydrogenedentota bacterium]